MLTTPSTKGTMQQSEKNKQDRSLRFAVLDRLEKLFVLIACIVGGISMISALPTFVGIVGQSGVTEVLKYILPLLGGLAGFTVGMQSIRKKKNKE